MQECYVSIKIQQRAPSLIPLRDVPRDNFYHQQSSLANSNGVAIRTKVEENECPEPDIYSEAGGDVPLGDEADSIEVESIPCSVSNAARPERDVRAPSENREPDPNPQAS